MKPDREQVMAALETGLRALLADLATHQNIPREELEDIHRRLLRLGHVMQMVQQTLVLNLPEQMELPLQLKDRN